MTTQISAVQVKDVARGKRQLLRCIAGLVLLSVVLFALGFLTTVITSDVPSGVPMDPSTIVGLVGAALLYLALVVYAAVTVFRLSRALGDGALAGGLLALVVLVLLPMPVLSLLGLLVLVLLNQRATRYLGKSGITVGFMGAGQGKVGRWVNERGTPPVQE